MLNCLLSHCILSALVYGNIALNVGANSFMQDWVKTLRSTYKIPLKDALTRTMLPAEAARVQLFQRKLLAEKNFLTLMTDGWDDAMHRSLYGTLTAERGNFPTVLSLEDITGKRGSAATIEEVLDNGLEKMGVDPKQLIGLVTDDPSVMGSVRNSFVRKYPWIIVSLNPLRCYLSAS